MGKPEFNIEEGHRFFAIELNQLVWSLLGKEKRSPEDNEQMLHAAHASLFHWMKIGKTANRQRGYWILSRVYCVLNNPVEAMKYAQLCMDITINHPEQMEDFDLAYAEEAIARAYACKGDFGNAGNYFAKAKEKGSGIKDKEGRDYFTGDLASGPWFGFAE